MKVSPTSVGNVVLRSNVVATLYEHSTNGVITLQNLKFTKFLATFFQFCVNFGSANILIFLHKLPSWEQQTLNV